MITLTVLTYSIELRRGVVKPSVFFLVQLCIKSVLLASVRIEDIFTFIII